MSTIKVNKIENTATADGGIAIDASGHVQIDGVQLPTAGALSNRNLIINGAMHVAQRGTSSTSNQYGTLDRFRAKFNDGAVTQFHRISVERPLRLKGLHFYRIHGIALLQQHKHYREIFVYRLKGQDLQQTGWRNIFCKSNVTLSFWARSSCTGKIWRFFDD